MRGRCFVYAGLYCFEYGSSQRCFFLCKLCQFILRFLVHLFARQRRHIHTNKHRAQSFKVSKFQSFKILKFRSFKISKCQNSSARKRVRAFLIASNFSARMLAESGSRWLKNAGTSRHFSSPAFPGRPAGPRREAISSSTPSSHDEVASLEGLTGRPGNVGDEKGRDVPASFSHSLLDSAGIWALEFEAIGKARARPRHWDFETLKFWNSEERNFGIFKYRNVETLKLLNFCSFV